MFNKLQSVLIGLAAVLLAATAVAAPAPDDARDPVRFAVLAFRPKPETAARWQPLVDYLNGAGLGRRFVLAPLTYPELAAAVKAREVGVVLTQPANYIQLAHSEGLHSPLATMIGRADGHELASFGGVIVAAAGRADLRSVEDLRGRRLAASEADSLGGYLMQAKVLLDKGIRMPDDAQIILTGVPHDRAVQEVLAGRADAAFVRTGVIEAMQREGKLAPGRLQVINSRPAAGFPFALSTPLYPEWAVSAMPWLEEDTQRQLAVALLALPHGGAVAASAGISGFTIPGNYQPVEELMRDLRVAPFDTAPEFTVRDVWQRYQAWGLLAAGVLFAGLAALVLALLHANRHLRAERGQTRDLLARLRDSEARYRSLVTSSPDWIWEVDARGVYTFASPRVQDILGYAPEELVGRHPFDLMTEGDAEWVRAEYADIVRSGRAFSGLVNSNRHKDGHVVILETSGTPVLDDAGQVVGYRGVDRDITARRQAEKELEAYRYHLEELVAQRTADLRAAETRYRTVADFTYDWETWIGPDGAWLYSSPSCLRVTGYPAEAFVARPERFMEVVHADDRDRVARHMDDHTNPADEVCQLTFRIIRADGSEGWLEHICQPVYDDRRCYLGRRASNRDVSARRRAEMALSEASEAVMVATAAKNAFLANMSHELRTPLHQIGGMAQLVRREPLSPRQAERMDKLEAALRHMTGLVERILELTRLESDRVALVQEPVDLATVLDNVATQVRERAEAKGLRLVTDADALPAGLLGDAMHLQAALSYLADNAVKFTEVGSVVLSVRLAEDSGADVLVRFQVDDTGIGIDPEVLPKLFTIFEQADNSPSRRYGGAGIGLAMVRKLARKMTGDAGCMSRPGAGSTFWFSARLKRPG